MFLVSICTIHKESLGDIAELNSLPVEIRFHQQIRQIAPKFIGIVEPHLNPNKGTQWIH